MKTTWWLLLEILVAGPLACGSSGSETGSTGDSGSTGSSSPGRSSTSRSTAGRASSTAASASSTTGGHSGTTSAGTTGTGTTTSSVGMSSRSSARGTTTGSSASGATTSSSAHGTTTGSSSVGTTASSTGASTGGAPPAGWLYTSGAKIYVSNGTSGTQWMGRGVNTDDVLFCGYDDSLWMTSPDTTVETVLSGLISGWHPNFLRISLSMDSFGGYLYSWINNTSQYATFMTNVIDSVGTYPGVYVLLTLRSDGSMIDENTGSGDAEATGLPSDSSSTPNASLYPTGTDAVYVALVDAFANSSFVLFGLTNEPGSVVSDSTLAGIMSHAVGTIRAEEDRLGVPHHLVSVQSNGWTSEPGYYSQHPLSYDNVVYEYHGYPPDPTAYTQTNIPVIIGEYGGSGEAASDATFTTAFYADVEAKQIPNLAWDFDPLNDCFPDLLTVSGSATNLTPTGWGSAVKSYLLSH